MTSSRVEPKASGSVVVASMRSARHNAQSSGVNSCTAVTRRILANRFGSYN
jgi:hypothetical protein